MAYTAPDFWFLVALAVAGTALLPAGARPAWLLILSLAFYALPDPLRLAWLGGIAGLVIAAPSLMDRARPWRVAGGAIAVLVALLVWAKFADAAGLPDPQAPPGLSFITFTAIAVLADAARQGQRWRGVALLLHLAWFPKLLAGPIERPDHLVPQFATLALRPRAAALGFTLILIGLVKKLVIADSLAPVVDAAYAIPEYAAPLDLLIASYFFAFQIYCDFSGYADIALGLSALVGLRLLPNFRQPYLAPTVTEFWAARWHITLGQWFRDYVYIPLGGSRRGRARRIANLMAVFLLSGLWHAGLGYGVGWGFLVWGALNGIYVVAETALPRDRTGAWRPIGILVTFHLVLIAWVFFRAASLSDALTILRRIAQGAADIPTILTAYPWQNAQIAGGAMILALMGTEIATGRIPLSARILAAPTPVRWAGWYVGLGAILLFGRWQGAQFVYAGF